MRDASAPVSPSLISLIVCALSQELEDNSKECEELGHVFGEKIAEEIAEAGKLKKNSSFIELCEVLTLEIVPEYFGERPKYRSDVEHRAEWRIFFSGSKVLEYCSTDSFLSILRGVFVTIAQKILEIQIEVKKVPKESLIIIIGESPLD